MVQKWAVVIVLALGYAGVAHAQGSGRLQVRVLDADRLALPRALVTISHEAGYVGTYTTPTDKDGVALFPVLRPGGGYIVTIAMPGFATRVESDVRVPIGDTASLRVLLSTEIVDQVTVTTAPDLIDLSDPSSRETFNDEFFGDLPVQGRSYNRILTLVPGVNDPDGDGNPIVHGSRARDVRTEVGGVSNVNPLTGQQLSQVNFDSIEEIQVIPTGAGVEFGRAQGAFSRIVLKQGTNQFEGTLGMLYRTAKLDGTGAHDLTALPDPKFQALQPSIQISGPIVRDKLWYRLSHELLDREDPVNTVGRIETQGTKRGIHSDQITWQVSPRNKLALRFQADPLLQTNFGVASTTPAESSQQIDTESRTYSLTWTAPYSPRLLVETTAAWQDLETILSPSEPNVANDCVTGDPFLEVAQCTNFQTQQVSGSHFVTNTSNSQRLSLISQATVFAGRIAGANHQFKFGVSIENERFFRDLDRRPNIGFTIRNPIQNPDADRTPEEIKIITATLAIPRESRVRATGTNWGVYFEDQITPSSNLVITAGLRVDREELQAQGLSPLDPASEQAAFFGALDGPQPLDGIFRDTFTPFQGLGDFVTELSTVTGLPEAEIWSNLSNVTRQSRFWNKSRGRQNMDINNTNVSPALAISWDPWKSGKNKFAASARRFYDKIILAVPLIENNPATTNLVFTAEDDPRTGALTVGALDRAINPAVNVEAIDRNIETPYQDEWRILYERELWQETSLRVEYVNRKFRNQLQNVDINHLPGDFGRCRMSDTANTLGLLASPGSGFEIVDPWSGETYVDTDPGDGDGRIDDCVGDIDVERDSNNVDVMLERPDGFTDLYTQNPGYGSVLVIGNYNRSDYEGVVLEIIRRQFRSWEMRASYTWSMSTGNGEDFRQFVGLDPSLLDDEYGYQSTDQRHVVKLSATSITPWGFRVGSNVTWSSGLPYSILAQDLAFDAVPPAYRSLGSFSPARPRLQYPTGERNSQRNDSQWLVDLKFTKELSLGHGMQLQLSAEIFNVFNDGTYQVFNPNFGSGFQINGIDNARFEFGRRWQLGMRLGF